ncbi:ERF family protein [Rhodocyclaceae bacterium SMB388]
MKNIAAALVKAQKAFGPALKTSSNPHFRSKYADLSACVEAVVDALNANGIMLSQTTRECEDGVIVETVFLHESGESWSSGPLHVPAPKSDPQGYGSALTYARRYSLMAACGIAPEDDDGNAGSQGKRSEEAAIEKARDALRSCTTMEELKTTWSKIPASLHKACAATKDAQKLTIEATDLTSV